MPLRRKLALSVLIPAVAAAPADASPQAAAPLAEDGPSSDAQPLLELDADQSLPAHDEPGGKVTAELSGRTRFGSQTVLPVVQRRGRWLGVLTTGRRAGEVKWVAPRHPRLRTTRTRMVADLSQRTLTVIKGVRRVATVRVTVGAPNSPTPTGRFAVTDKLAGSRFGNVYGRFVVALSGHQPNPPGGWRGGTRMAVHGTSSGTAGAGAQSAGCLRASDDALQRIVDDVPTGAVLQIKE